MKQKYPRKSWRTSQNNFRKKYASKNIFPAALSRPKQKEGRTKLTHYSYVLWPLLALVMWWVHRLLIAAMSHLLNQGHICDFGATEDDWINEKAWFTQIYPAAWSRHTHKYFLRYEAGFLPNISSMTVKGSKKTGCNILYKLCWKGTQSPRCGGRPQWWACLT